MGYFDELKKSMEWLAQQKNTIFIGQGVVPGGVFMYNTLKDVPLEKRVEWPVTEAMQMGAAVGLAMGGFVPVTVFPRHNFLLLALSELVNLLDKLPEITKGKYLPKVLIRTAVGTTKPIYPGVQHAGDFTEALKKVLTTVEFIDLKEAADIFPAYQYAYNKEGAVLLSEYGDYYSEK